ncbi:YlbG family protein [Virgibacillus sp. MSP4-1]|nr:YlbG family protein [Virgibacillus sp. MSP4-1]QHS22142.1 YlbG family protein [Virgibacillus sp. MSP4-1]
MFTKRQGIFVWVKNIKNGRKLRRFGHIITMSKKQRYVLLYVNQEDTEDKLQQLQKLPFVIKAEPSYKPFIRTEFENEKAKEIKEEESKYGF